MLVRHSEQLFCRFCREWAVDISPGQARLASADSLPQVAALRCQCLQVPMSNRKEQWRAKTQDIGTRRSSLVTTIGVCRIRP